MTRKRAACWLTTPCLAALAAFAGCSPPPAPSAQSRADQATMSACRQRADEVFQRQNRAALFTQDNRDTPQSASYASGVTTRGLADRFGWDSQVADCVRNQGASEGALPATQPPSPGLIAAPGPAMEPRPH